MVASVDAVVARARPVLYCSGNAGVSGTPASPVGVADKCFFEPPKDQDRPDLRRDVGLGVV